MILDKYIIYGLTDPRNGLIRYVGKSTKGLSRARGHIHHAKVENNYKAKWIRKLSSLGLDYGIEILEICSTPEKLSEAEKRWIADLRERDLPLTNLTDGGEGMCGYRPSPKTLEKMKTAAKLQMSVPANRERFRQMNLGNKHSLDTRKKISKSHKGKTATPETRIKLSMANKGKKRSKETLVRMSIAAIGKVSGFKGKTHTAKTREKLRLAGLGKSPSKETRRKLSRANSGRKQSVETRLKRSKSMKGNQNCKGRKLSAESRKKISEAQKRRWAVR